MASGRKITVEFLGNNRDLDRAMDSSASRAGRFGSALKKAGKVAALGLAAGAVIAGKALFDMTKGAIEDEAAAKKLAQTLRTAAGATDDQVASVEEWISAQGKALGITDDELRPALERLAVATGDVDEAQRLATLAFDVAAGSGKSLQQVTEAMVKAQNGSVGGLSRLGVATKDAEGHTKSFAAIQEDLAKKFEGASAKAADTTAGKMQRLKVAFSEAGEEIGYKLIPVVTAMAEWFLNKGLPAIQDFGGWIKTNLVPIFKDVSAAISGAFGGGTSGEVSSNLGKIRDTVMSVVAVIQALWNKFGADIIAYTGAAFRSLMQIIGGALDIIRGIVMVFTSLFQGDWQGVWDGIKLILSGALDVILGLVKQSLALLGLMFKVAWEAIKALAGAAWEGIKSQASKGLDAVVDYVTYLPKRLVAGLSTLKEDLKLVFGLAMTAGLEKVKNLGDDIVGWIKGIPGKLSELGSDFKTAGKGLIEAFITGLSNAAGFVSNIAGNVWTALKGMINAAIDKINAALSFSFDTHVPGVGTVSVNPPDIPHLAKGGVVRSPMLALIGEDGPEAVVPLGRKNAPRGDLGISGGGTVVNIQLLSLDPRQSWNVIVDGLRQAERQTGRQMLVSPA